MPNAMSDITPATHPLDSAIVVALRENLSACAAQLIKTGTNG